MHARKLLAELYSDIKDVLTPEELDDCLDSQPRPFTHEELMMGVDMIATLTPSTWKKNRAERANKFFDIYKGPTWGDLATDDFRTTEMHEVNVQSFKGFEIDEPSEIYSDDELEETRIDILNRINIISKIRENGGRAKLSVTKKVRKS